MSIAVESLVDWLPHRPPFVWVDEVVHFSEEGGECLVILKKDAGYMSPEGLRPSALIEFAAQSFGYISAAFAASHGIQISVKKAYLTSLKDGLLPVCDDLKPGDQLRVLIDSIRQVGTITLLRGQIFRGSQLFSEVHLRVFSEKEEP